MFSIRNFCKLLLVLSFGCLFFFSFLEFADYSGKMLKITSFGCFLVFLGLPVAIASGMKIREGYRTGANTKVFAASQAVLLFDLLIGFFIIALGTALLV